MTGTGSWRPFRGGQPSQPARHVPGKSLQSARRPGPNHPGRSGPFLVKDEYEEGLRQAGVAGLGNPELRDNLVPFESVSGKAFLDGQPVVVDDYITHPDSIASGISQGVRSAVVLPVKGSEGIVGVLDVVSRETGYFTPERGAF